MSELDELARRVRTASNVLVLTGAGMSAESGVPTFRDAQTGLWSRFRPEDLATPEAFARDPKTVWNWYAWRREMASSVAPHAGHLALAELERRLGGHCTLVTQNVDGLHQRAGSQRVIELHGNILRTICSITRRPIDEAWLEQHCDDQPPPSPHHPRGLARPDVVWFGESLPEGALNDAWRAAEHCDLCLVVGTSSLGRTPHSGRVSQRIEGTAAQVLPALVMGVELEAPLRQHPAASP
jgi:NAD-dependent deacetylase